MLGEEGIDDFTNGMNCEARKINEYKKEGKNINKKSYKLRLLQIGRDRKALGSLF